MKKLFSPSLSTDQIMPASSKTIQYTDNYIIELRKRNHERAMEAKEKMGEVWVLHPSNSPKKIEQKSVLG
jgi:hypothetical protein